MKNNNNYNIALNKQSANSLKIDGFERMSFNFDEDFSKEDLLSLIKNNFNKDDKEYNYRFVNGYHIIDHLPNENLDLTKSYYSVEYKYNEDFFRCDNFKNSHEGFHVLFSGCSNTEGVGCNIQDTWTDMVYSSLSKSIKTSGYFNLAKGGMGTQNIVSNFITYVEKYGAPDLFIVLHPNLLRSYRWSSQRNQWEFKQDLPPSPKLKNVNEYREAYMNEILNWFVEWNLFISYCNSVGTKIIWSTWEHQESASIINSGLFDETFVELPSISKELIQKECPDGKCADLVMNARDGHPGTIFHKNVYNLFWETLKTKGIVND